MADQNETNPIADAPASEDLVTTEDSTVAGVTEGRSWKQSLSWAAVAAALVVGGVGGYAAGNSNGDHSRIEMANHQSGLHDGPAVGVTGETRGQGGMGHGGKGGKHGGGMQDGQRSDMAPHCHDANGTDTEVGANGLCADGSQPGFRGKGNDKGMGKDDQLTPNVSPSPSTSSSAVTN